MDSEAPRLARLADVARRAGVSPASADRALHRRPGVRAATAERVLKAAAELRYISQTEFAAAAAPLPMRLVFLLPAGTNQFLVMLARLIVAGHSQALAHAAICRVETIKSFDPAVLARQLLRHGKQADGIAFMAIEHPAVRDAVNQLAGRGVPVITLISDVANSRRVAYVGLDNRSAGRTAGYLMARFIRERPVKVAVIAGSLSYSAHGERELGLRSILAEMAPDMEIVGIREGHDEDSLNHRQTRLLLAAHPDLAGIYNVGGASGGIARALAETRREGKIVLIGHGRTPDTRRLLVDGVMDAVITQNPQSAFLDCLSIFANLRAGHEPMQGMGSARSEIVFRENLTS
ncbi:LacI family DNA-binding transcriptional regulator [Acidisphaera sp. L21]|uniref:LacI family DNA-binding transcriptional regulator n=1 Tax=Acidisphaera sp. L21 TaxID=1641851 RepID=UPI00131D265D|nr:LacI family DNA-binding transcriptional regulator [Acidisphaera sp. L21]